MVIRPAKQQIRVQPHSPPGGAEHSIVTNRGSVLLFCLQRTINPRSRRSLEVPDPEQAGPDSAFEVHFRGEDCRLDLLDRAERLPLPSESKRLLEPAE